MLEPGKATPATPMLGQGSGGLRIAVAGDYFARGAMPEAFEAVAKVAAALGADETVTIPEAARARAAAYVITTAEGGNLHLERLRTRAADFDPATRDRLLAGAMVPASWYLQAQRFRRWYHDRVMELFTSVDIILAPATPCTAPPIGQQTMVLDGVEMLVRPNIGIFTQPLSLIGLPIVAVPVQRPGGSADRSSGDRGSRPGGSGPARGRRTGSVGRLRRTRGIGEEGISEWKSTIRKPWRRSPPPSSATRWPW